jgi:hypothetical protein
MNRKGAYSGIIASIAIVAIIAVAFNSSAIGRAQSEKDYAKAIVDLKREWLTARYLLDKSASDAIADNGFSIGCSGNNNSIESTLGDDGGGYFRSTLDEASLETCHVNNVGVSGNITVNVDIYCEKTIDGIEIRYGKDRVQFNKTATYDSGPPCTIDVKDDKSDVCEVDTIIGGGCGA